MIKDGHAAYEQSFGLAELGTNKKMTSHSLLPIGSLSKQFTAVAIMLLVEQGHLDLDRHPAHYLSYFTVDDERQEQITLRQLLANRSGLPSQRQRLFGYDSSDPGDQALEKFVRSLASSKLKSTPGSEFLYSNWGFNVLGDIVAKVSGLSYEQFIQRNIFDPLQMTNSSFDFGQEALAMAAVGHYVDQSSEVKSISGFPYTRAYNPSAGLVSNQQDLQKWAQALLGDFLSAASWQEITKSAQATHWGVGDWFDYYGLAWFVHKVNGHTLHMHDGINPGFSASITLSRTEGIAVVTTENLFDLAEQGPFYASDVSNQAMLLLISKP